MALYVSTLNEMGKGLNKEPSVYTYIYFMTSCSLKCLYLILVINTQNLITASGRIAWDQYILSGEIRFFAQSFERQSLQVMNIIHVSKQRD
jgi:hypothetical protein